ncbi:MAG TPA: PH domain-containing protein, partial [Pseudonocardia sp.]|nr:PH domain-containing protein [Pseudonocardia sp.]
MLAPREIDEYLLPTERRVIRLRQHWAVMLGEVTNTALFLLALVIGESLLPDSVLIDNLAFYLALDR